MGHLFKTDLYGVVGMGVLITFASPCEQLVISI